MVGRDRSRNGSLEEGEILIRTEKVLVVLGHVTVHEVMKFFGEMALFGVEAEEWGIGGMSMGMGITRCDLLKRWFLFFGISRDITLDGPADALMISAAVYWLEKKNY